MKNIFIFTLVATASIYLTGCAVGPLVNHETARTVGENKSELIAGYGRAGYVAKWNLGLMKDWDIGVQWESLSIGVRTKYAFIHEHERGFSFAGAAGIGSSFGGSHYYADLIASYLIDSWEPYATLRAVHVKTDPLEFKDKDTGNVDFTVSKMEYEYGQFMIGTRYWFDKHWLLSAEGSFLFRISPGVDTTKDILVSGALGYRF